MSELQKIILGLLGTTHPEIERARSASPDDAAPRDRSQRESGLRAFGRALKFAFAALVAGSRFIPLGDNGCITRELGIYGARLRR